MTVKGRGRDEEASESVSGVESGGGAPAVDGAGDGGDPWEADMEGVEEVDDAGSPWTPDGEWRGVHEEHTTSRLNKDPWEEETETDESVSEGSTGTPRVPPRVPPKEGNFRGGVPRVPLKRESPAYAKGEKRSGKRKR